MQTLAPYIAPLSLQVPPPTEQRSIIDKISAKQVEHRIRKEAKVSQKRSEKLQEKGREKGKSAKKDWEKVKRMEYIIIESL